jgi:exopolyphosphatase / guanosine-5'-triphosphate,3'-diphosphate pyrophosphatase
VPGSEEPPSSDKLGVVAFACVDIGSNTTRLLVADASDGRLRELMTQRVYNQLGESLGKEGTIPRDKVEETADTVATQARHAHEYGARRVDVVATAAVRDARNGAELAAAVEAGSGLPVRILSGDEEARLSFLGATKALGAPVDGRVAVVDVGGGSTEIAIGAVTGGVEWSETFRVGSGFLTDNYVRSDPPAPVELQSVREHVTGTFEGLETPAVERAVAVGGSATSLRRVVGAELSHDALERGIRILCTTPIDEVARRFELDPRRVRLLPAGILVLETVGDRLGHALTIGGGGLREGVIIEMVAAAEAA